MVAETYVAVDGKPPQMNCLDDSFGAGALHGRI